MDPAVLPSQQVGYPPEQQQYYPAPQQFPPSKAPPPYYTPQPQPPYYTPQPQPQPPQGGYAPAPAQMQSSSNNVVVVSQPGPIVATQIAHPVGDHFLTLSISLSVLCCLFGSWHSLLCTIPAIVFATMARDAETRGDLSDAYSKGRIALILNIISLVFWILGIVVGIIAFIYFNSAAK